MTKSVAYSTTTRLSCCGATPPPSVTLCLSDSSLLLSKTCCGTDTAVPFDFTTIDAVMTQCIKACSPCGTPQWTYVFQYDETLLTTPSVALTAANIVGVFCKGCITDWVEQLAGDPVCLVNNDNGTLTLVNQFGCEFTFSPSSGGTLDFANTPTVDLVVCGDFYKTVTANVLLSGDLGNGLEIHSDGLFIDKLNNWLFGPASTSTQITYDVAHALIKAGTVDGADNLYITIAGGGAGDDPSRGASVTIYGNEAPGIPGGINLGLGSVANATVDLGYGGGVSSHVRAYANSVLQWQTTNAVAFDFKNAANESVGASNAAFGAANCPAAVPTDVHTWLKVFISDGSTAYIPVWK